MKKRQEEGRRKPKGIFGGSLFYHEDDSKAKDFVKFNTKKIYFIEILLWQELRSFVGVGKCSF